MAKKEEIKKEAVLSSQNYLGKDLKRFFFLTGILVLIVIILTVVDKQTGFLTKFTHSFITKLIGK